MHFFSSINVTLYFYLPNPNPPANNQHRGEIALPIFIHRLAKMFFLVNLFPFHLYLTSSSSSSFSSLFNFCKYYKYRRSGCVRDKEKRGLLICCFLFFIFPPPSPPLKISTRHSHSSLRRFCLPACFVGDVRGRECVYHRDCKGVYHPTSTM